jgi:two-component system C4-dicarboxylate transport sensor histidine kinase DctB
MEEVLARGASHDPQFAEQAARIVMDEVESLERRVRAFSEFSAEPPVRPMTLDLNRLVEERIALLGSGHPDVRYMKRLAGRAPLARADEDLVKGILTNLLENAADAAGSGGSVLIATGESEGRAVVEVHDSGPGLSEQARESLFEPTISFKKRGMGLGLSIVRKNALLTGGDVELIGGHLGGAAFRITLPAAG